MLEEVQEMLEEPTGVYFGFLHTLTDLLFYSLICPCLLCIYICTVNVLGAGELIVNVRQPFT